MKELTTYDQVSNPRFLHFKGGKLRRAIYIRRGVGGQYYAGCSATFKEFRKWTADLDYPSAGIYARYTEVKIGTNPLPFINQLHQQFGVHN